MEKDNQSGEIIESSPYKPPKKRHGQGRWEVASRHIEKHYTLTWRWVPKQSDEIPPEMPPDGGLLTKAEYKLKKAEEKRAERNQRSGQPEINFSPDERTRDD